MRYLHHLPVTVVLLSTFACSDQPGQSPSAQKTPAAVASEEGHHHEDTPHGGTIIDWGGGTYHVEFTVDHDARSATVYILGNDAVTPAPVKADKLLLVIKEPAFQIDLMPNPQAGETAEGVSRFSGSHEHLGTVREFAGTISGVVDGTPYAGDFAEETGAHGHAQ
jgi:hypothetical protein